MFSCTDLLRSSYLTNTCEKSLTVFVMMKKRAHPRKTMATMKMMLIFQLMNTHMKMLKMRLSGALTDALRICWNAFCRLLTSVVMRVMSPDDENRSMLEKENVCMFLYMASLRLYANPVEAYAELVPAWMPKKRERNASASMSPP